MDILYFYSTFCYYFHSTKLFEEQGMEEAMTVTRRSVMGLLFKCDDVLMVQEKVDDPRTGKVAGMLSPIAGWVDEGETPEQAVIREALEEAGISVRIKEFLWPVFFLNDIVIHVFLLEPSSEVVVISDEWLNPRWVPVIEIFRMSPGGLRPPVQAILRKIVLGDYNESGIAGIALADRI